MEEKTVKKQKARRPGGKTKRGEMIGAEKKARTLRGLWHRQKDAWWVVEYEFLKDGALGYEEYKYAAKAEALKKKIEILLQFHPEVAALVRGSGWEAMEFIQFGVDPRVRW